jgi:hypothetical protein
MHKVPILTIHDIGMKSDIPSFMVQIDFFFSKKEHLTKRICTVG